MEWESGDRMRSVSRARVFATAKSDNLFVLSLPSCSSFYQHQFFFIIIKLSLEPVIVMYSGRKEIEVMMR